MTENYPQPVDKSVSNKVTALKQAVKIYHPVAAHTPRDDGGPTPSAQHALLHPGRPPTPVPHGCGTHDDQNGEHMTENASELEKKGYNMMSNSSLDATKLEQLGWRALFDLQQGATRTLKYYSPE